MEYVLLVFLSLYIISSIVIRTLYMSPKKYDYLKHTTNAKEESPQPNESSLSKDNKQEESHAKWYEVVASEKNRYVPVIIPKERYKYLFKDTDTTEDMMQKLFLIYSYEASLKNLESSKESVAEDIIKYFATSKEAFAEDIFKNIAGKISNYLDHKKPAELQDNKVVY